MFSSRKQSVTYYIKNSLIYFIIFWLSFACKIQRDAFIKIENMKLIEFSSTFNIMKSKLYMECVDCVYFFI